MTLEEFIKTHLPELKQMESELYSTVPENIWNKETLTSEEAKALAITQTLQFMFNSLIEATEEL